MALVAKAAVPVPVVTVTLVVPVALPIDIGCATKFVPRVTPAVPPLIAIRSPCTATYK